MRRSKLRARGFRGFFTVSDLRNRGTGKITRDAGVYAVLRLEAGTPTFLSRNQGGHFKGKDPTVNTAILKRRWVQGTQVLYFGKTDDLRRRIDELCRFGAGQPVGHWGGRHMWQIGGSDKFIVAWLPVSSAVGERRSLMDEFRAAFGSWPFANLQGPQKAVPKRVLKVLRQPVAQPTNVKAKQRRRRARNRYKPTRLRCLFIAEAPPTDDRYFYFDDVQTADWLFLGVMKVLFPDESASYTRRPDQKRSLLKRFQDAGYWLLDAVDDPLVGAPAAGLPLAHHLRQQSDLIRRLGQLMAVGSLSRRVPIVLIKATVYDAFTRFSRDGNTA